MGGQALHVTKAAWHVTCAVGATEDSSEALRGGSNQEKSRKEEREEWDCWGRQNHDPDLHCPRSAGAPARTAHLDLTQSI